jgi:hypothetical protein
MSKKIYLGIIIFILMGLSVSAGYFLAQNSSKEQAQKKALTEKELALLEEQPAIIKSTTTESEVQKEQDQVDSQIENPTKANIELVAMATSAGVKLTWKVNGINALDGFKLVKSLEPNPTYPGSNYIYITDTAKREYVWGILDGKTYNFRVCQYVGSKCAIYSNNVVVKAPIKTVESTKSNEKVTSITLSSVSGSKISWKASGYSESGFKVVWSKNPNPTYPTRDGDKYHYYSEPTKTSDTVDAFDGEGEYYVRVCEYLGGKCGTYSNQIAIVLE